MLSTLWIPQPFALLPIAFKIVSKCYPQNSLSHSESMNLFHKADI